ncbi:MAG: AAA family ATPase [Clostridia bacterium]
MFGYSESGKLTDKVRIKPYSIILFDEIEKAHSDIYNLLLQVLDDGILTDSTGRVVDFKNTIIILTSNIGAKNITSNNKFGFNNVSSIKQENEIIKKEILKEVKNTFKPEFINRLDNLVIFNKLNNEDIEKITKILLDELCIRIKDKNINISYTDNLVKHIASDNDYNYGARPIKRKIQDEVEQIIADYIIDEKIKTNDTVKVDYINDKVVVK